LFFVVVILYTYAGVYSECLTNDRAVVVVAQGHSVGKPTRSRSVCAVQPVRCDWP